MTLRQVYAQVEKSTGRPVKEMIGRPTCPESVKYLWDMFSSINTIGPLTYTELKNWSELSAVPLQPFEAEALISLDRTYWSTINVRKRG